MLLSHPIFLFRVVALVSFFFFNTFLITSQIPNVTVRFANPTFECGSDQYCVDVEFQSDLENVELFGMNVRFFYDDAMMEIDSIKDFQGGYGPQSAPIPFQSGPGFGITFFDLPAPGVVDWVNTSIQLIDDSQPPVFLSTTGWTKLFQVCFIIEGEVSDSNNFCPSIIWDLELDPENGGYIPGDDGVVIAVVGEPVNIPANESVLQFNWEYTGDGSSTPYGAPVQTICSNLSCIICPSIFPEVPSDTICPDEFVEFEIVDLESGLVTYSWNFGSGAIPMTGSGIGPHVVQYAGTFENETTGASVILTMSKEGCPDASAQVSVVKVNALPDATINGNTTSGCYYLDRVFSPVAPEIPGATYNWDFGYGAVPAVATGYGPHTVYYDTAGLKTVSLVIYPNAPGAQCIDSSSITFQITYCPSNITGIVKSSSNMPISGVNLRLYEDVDLDGIADNSTAIRSVYSSSTGSYAMALLTPGNYVIFQIQPTGWNSVSDGDPTIDNDIVANISALDNIIPVTLVPSEFDGINTFIEAPLAGDITGSVFDDADGDNFPDVFEGIEGILLKLYLDSDADGVADSGVPVDSTVTLEDGTYMFADVPIGNYVLVEFEPNGYVSIDDFDNSDDDDEAEYMETGIDTIQVTIGLDEIDEDNFFIDDILCSLIVTNPNDDGSGSLREVIECIPENDTVFFHPSLTGSTISINSARLLIDKNVIIYSSAMPRITLSSQITGFFDIMPGTEVEIVGLDIVSGLSGNNGAAFMNEGSLSLKNVHILRNILLPSGQYLIYNSPSSELFFYGDCRLEMD